MSEEFSFAVHATDGRARTGAISTPRGMIRTPAFMPVGTAATVKAMHPNAVRALGYDIVLSNTYHLMLAPGAERIAALGGLHKFMNWPHPILTDSGGFQVMSLAKLRKLSERGVTFQSHIDGSRHELTPERSMEVQRLLGSDIQMQLDECVRLPCSYDEIDRAMRLSLRWAERSKTAFGEQPGRAIFGIVQGGTETDLRLFSAQALVEMDFHGYSIGGWRSASRRRRCSTRSMSWSRISLSISRAISWASERLTICFRRCGEASILCDCVMPTRAGRHGMVFTRQGRLNIRNARFADDPRPIDSMSSSPMARDYSRAYWRHLVKSGEILAMMGLTEINLAYYQDLMSGARLAISEGRLDNYIAETQQNWAEGEANER